MMNRNMLKQAQDMQRRLAQVQEELAQALSEGTAGGGVVKAVVQGGNRLESIEMLQDLVLAAVNDALDSAAKEAAEKMGKITGGLNIPGLM
jgi:DNA-binding protein YbaB